MTLYGSTAKQHSVSAVAVAFCPRPRRQIHQLLLRHRSTPPDAFAHDHDRQQVSWLAGHRFGPPSQRPCPSPVAFMVVSYPPTVAGAAADLYSRARTAFPWLALSGTTGHKRGIGSCRESNRLPPPCQTASPLKLPRGHTDDRLMPSSKPPIWRNDIDALAFQPGEHIGLCMVHRRAFRTLLRATPSPQECVEFFNAHQEAFQAAARAKLLRTQRRNDSEFSPNEPGCRPAVEKLGSRSRPFLG